MPDPVSLVVRLTDALVYRDPTTGLIHLHTRGSDTIRLEMTPEVARQVGEQLAAVGRGQQ